MAQPTSPDPAIPIDDGSPDTGWVLRLAITDPHAGLSWAVSAADSD